MLLILMNQIFITCFFLSHKYSFKIKCTSKNYVLRNPISQKTRKSLHDNGIMVNYQIFQSASTDFLISKQERMQIPFKNSPIEIYNDTCCMSNSLNQY